MSRSSPHSLLSDFQDHLRRSRLIVPHQALLVACSGGVDSMVLLHLVRSLAADWNLRIVAAHVDHGLREDSARAAALVRNFCRQQGIPVRVRKLDPEHREPGSSPEAWAREHRYRILEALRKRERCDLILTAHHAYDQAETILMRLGDGCGMSGLRGIRSRRERIVRPLLPFSRTVLESYAHARQLPCSEDRTNFDLAIPRNFIRHQILAPWEDAAPGVAARIGSLTERLAEYDQLREYVLQPLRATLVRDQAGGGFRIERRGLLDLPLLMSMELIRTLMGHADRPWRRHRWEGLRWCIRQARTGQFLELPGNWVLLRNRQEFILSPEQDPEQVHILVEPGATSRAGKYRLAWRPVTEAGTFPSDPWTEIMAAEALEGKQVVLRNWQSGDRFRPLGMNVEKKVSDFLVDARVDRFQKRQQLVLTADGEIVWLCGRRLSEHARVTPRTRRLVELSLTRNVG